MGLLQSGCKIMQLLAACTKRNLKPAGHPEHFARQLGSPPSTARSASNYAAAPILRDAAFGRSSG